MAPRPSTRNDPSRIHERPPDPVEASRTPLERKESADPRGGPEPPDPHHELTHPAHDPDPTSDSDPYEREPEGPGTAQGAAADRPEDEPVDPDGDPELKRAAMEGLRPPDDE
jgi:hypothetical protein